MKNDTPPPRPQSAEDIQRMYDEILADMREKDPLSRGFRSRIDAHNRKIRRLEQERHALTVGLREADRMVKMRAADKLRHILGVKALPGFRAERETQAHFRARMSAAKTTAIKSGALPPDPTEE